MLLYLFDFRKVFFEGASKSSTAFFTVCRVTSAVIHHVNWKFMWLDRALFMLVFYYSLYLNLCDNFTDVEIVLFEPKGNWRRGEGAGASFTV